ncbi:MULTISPECIES: hypothetical protein [unclassified Pseudomonas]|uniref:hypothetical protein n=1 Tax=unclassified Pseudomonas TaxID=196821 RepID=UPI00111BD7C2|nr:MULTISPECIES: hypothetical protein [unclassified Pseudomonas]
MKLQTLAVLTFTLGLVSLPGCVHSPFEQSWPVPPADIINLKPPVLSETPDTPLHSSTVFGQSLLGLIDKYYDNRNRMDWANGDFTAIGVVGALAGVVSGQPGLMNTGAGMSALGTTASARYQYASQRGIYESGRKATNCVIGVAGRIDDNAVIWAANQTINAQASKVAQSFPEDVLDAFTTIQSRLINRLGALQNQPPNGSDFQKYFNEQVNSKNLQNETQRDLANRRTDIERLKLAQLNAPPATRSRLLQSQQNLLLEQEAQLRSYQLESKRVPEDRQQEYLTKIIAAGPDLIACYAGF